MATESEQTRSFPAAAPVEQHRLLKLASGYALHTGAGDAVVGVATAAAAANEPVAAKLWGRWSTFVCVADGAIAVGDALYAAASGKVSKTVAGSQIGTALTATTAADQEIEVLPV